MIESPQVIEQGSIFYATCGRYSDYCTIGVFRAKQQLICEDLKRKFVAQAKRKDYFEAYKFISWLEQQNLIETLPSAEWDMESGPE